MEILESKSIIEIKNSLEGLTGRFEHVEDRIREPDDRSIEVVSWRNRKKEKEGKWTESQRAVKHNEIYQYMNTGSPRKRGERERGRKSIWRNNGWKLFKFDESYILHIQETQWTPRRRNSKGSTPIHIIIKLPQAKDKENILKAAREKVLITYKGSSIRLTADFSSETIVARGQWNGIFIQSNGRKRFVNQEFYTQRKYPSKLKEN